MANTNHDDSASAIEAARRFTPTHWSVVLAARGDSTAAHQALETLCRTYWQPIYSFVRRDGHGPQDAEDLTHEFFHRLIEKDSLRSVDRSKGRFRSFLLAAVKHFLANEWDKAHAQKRGGGQVLVPIDAQAAESEYAREPADNLTAEKLFDRRWALSLLGQVLARLREEQLRNGKAGLFEKLKGTLTGDRGSILYAQIAAEMKMSEGAVKVVVHRLRQRYRELIRDEIAQTVAGPAEVEDEMRSLFAALSN